MSLVLEKAVNWKTDGAVSWDTLYGKESWTCSKQRVIPSSEADTIPKILAESWCWVTKYPDCHQSWSKFSKEFALFCLAAGCPKESRTNPFESLEALRDHVSRQLAYTADLHNRIHKLNTQIILQQRMITALAYRDVIENLSMTADGGNSTEKWTKFVETIFSRPGTSTNTISADHPFNTLYARELPKRHGSLLLKEMAIRLFGELSRTIHNF